MKTVCNGARGIKNSHMSNLNEQLQALTTVAIMSIAVELDKNKGVIVFAENIDRDNQDNSEDDFYRLVADKTLW